MSGHSFGASTTQAVSDQTFEYGRTSYTDSRIEAAAMFSPSSPRHGGDSSRSFGRVSTPWILMTGESGKCNPNHHCMVLALSTAFLDAYLKESAVAKAWLNEWALAPSWNPGIGGKT